MTRRRTARRRPVAPRQRVFISHASSDHQLAQRLATLLSDHDVDCWHSQHVIRGADWYRAIGKALASCNWLIVVATPAAVRSRWVREEVTYALINNRYTDHVIPLLFKKCQLARLAWSLRSRQHVDFRRRWAKASAELLVRLR
jgi:TIR domain